MKTYVINLAKRTDRMEEMKSAGVPFPYERFPATESSEFIDVQPNARLRAHYACHDSHLRLLKKIRDDGDEMAMVLEDDCDFISNFSSDKIMEIMYGLPDDWDFLYLGGVNNNKISHNEFVDFAYNIYQTHAYIIRKKFLNTLIYQLENWQYKVDVVFSEALKLGKCFICNPPIAVQRESESDIDVLSVTKSINNN